jgi:hypothetical protein
MNTKRVFSKVKSAQKREELGEVLKDPDAGHSDRCWFGGFLLNFIGYSEDEVFDIIHEHAEWSDYDPGTTRKQLRSLDN